MLEHLHNSSLFRISKEWLVSTKSSFVKLCDCVWCYLSPPSPQPSLVPHNLSFVLNDEIGSFLAVFIGNTIKRHHSCHCRWSPLLDMSIRIRILWIKRYCQNWNQTKIDKRREKRDLESEKLGSGCIPSETLCRCSSLFTTWLALVIVYLKKVSKVVAGSGFSSITWHAVGLTIVWGKKTTFSLGKG